MLLVRKTSNAPSDTSSKPGGRAARLLNDKLIRIYVPIPDAPHDHASLSCECFVPFRHRSHPHHVGAFLFGMSVCTNGGFVIAFDVKPVNRRVKDGGWPILSLPLPFWAWNTTLGPFPPLHVTTHVILLG